MLPFNVMFHFKIRQKKQKKKQRNGIEKMNNFPNFAKANFHNKLFAYLTDKFRL